MILSLSDITIHGHQTEMLNSLINSLVFSIINKKLIFAHTDSSSASINIPLSQGIIWVCFGALGVNEL